MSAAALDARRGGLACIALVSARCGRCITRPLGKSMVGLDAGFTTQLVVGIDCAHQKPIATLSRVAHLRDGRWAPRRKKDPNKPKAATTSFFFFMSDNRASNTCVDTCAASRRWQLRPQTSRPLVIIVGRDLA